MDIIEKCDKCKLHECINCEHSWADVQELKQKLKEKDKEIKHLNRCLSKRGLSEVDFYKRLREKEDEIEKLNKKILDWQDGSMALKIEKETRHQVCEEIRKYIHTNEYDELGLEYLMNGGAILDKLDQIEGEK